MWCLYQALQDWPYIHRTHETKYPYVNLVGIQSKFFQKDQKSIETNGFECLRFNQKAQILCKETFGTNQWKLLQTLKCMFAHWVNLLSYAILQNVCTKCGNTVY